MTDTLTRYRIALERIADASVDGRPGDAARAALRSPKEPLPMGAIPTQSVYFHVLQQIAVRCSGPVAATARIALCDLKQLGDSMHCPECGRSWAVGDLSPPPCHRAP